MSSYKLPRRHVGARTPGRWRRVALALFVSALSACSRDVPMPDAAPLDETQAATQQQAFVDAMKPRRAGKPVVAVLAFNAATETTDFLLSHAVLVRSGLAEVRAVAAKAGRVTLYPAFEIEVTQDFAAFDAAHPNGADYVVVPALDDSDDPATLAWLRRQAARGARIVAVCAGALPVGRAGLLDGRRFATHWYYRKDVLERHPSATYVPHRRYVVDRDVASTTGITASVPAMLALVEAIGGRPAAQALARDLGVSSWTPAHDSGAFGLDARRAVSYLLAKAAFWRDEARQVHVQDGVDDIALALAADAWSRTGHVQVEAAAGGPVRLRSGLVLLTQPADATRPRLELDTAVPPVRQLDRTLCDIEARFGAARREWVAMELEYPGRPACGS